MLGYPEYVHGYAEEVVLYLEQQYRSDFTGQVTMAEAYLEYE